MDIKFGFTSASKNVGNKDENGKRVQSKISNVVANIKAICAYCEKEFEYKPSYGGTHTYCSPACAAAAKKVTHEPNTKCFACGKPIYIKPSRIARSKSGKFTCSKECMGKMRSMIFTGSNNPNYHEETISYYENNGFKYQRIKLHNHPYKGFQDYYPYHRYIVEQNHNMFDDKYFNIIDGQYYLKPEVNIHHKNENTLNNNISNLIPLTMSEHRKLHNSTKEIIRDEKGRIAGVFKQGELLENHSDNDNQQPSNDRNIVEGSTTNSRGLTDNADAGNADTSALPTK